MLLLFMLFHRITNIIRHLVLDTIYRIYNRLQYVVLPTVIRYINSILLLYMLFRRTVNMIAFSFAIIFIQNALTSDLSRPKCRLQAALIIS